MTQRKIAFRAWLNDEKRMVSPDELSFGYQGQLTAIGYDGEGGVLVEVSEQGATVMQFTGLHDKNGKEIWEGDIVADEEGGYDFIEWSDHWAGWTTGYWFGSEELAKEAHNLEVIGNVFENPELIQSLKK